mgnify:CR=1 FL=1
MPLSIAAIIEVTRALGMCEGRIVTLRRALTSESGNVRKTPRRPPAFRRTKTGRGRRVHPEQPLNRSPITLLRRELARSERVAQSLRDLLAEELQGHSMLTADVG